MLAEDGMTPKARSAVQALLQGDAQGNGNVTVGSLAQISTWADDIRTLRPETRPWHYVNIELEEKGYSASADTPNVVTALEREIAVLADANADRYARQEALKWVVHLVGDLHQPLHVGEDHDKGGNLFKVKVNRRTHSLHQVWDFLLIERLHLPEDALRTMLETDLARNPAFLLRNAQGTVRGWVDETHAKASACYLLHGKPMRKGIKISLDKDYVQAATLTVLEQLRLAGIRLAFVLNGALDPQGPRQPTWQAYAAAARLSAPGAPGNRDAGHRSPTVGNAGGKPQATAARDSAARDTARSDSERYFLHAEEMRIDPSDPLH